jgi:hypothetical protein
MSQTPLNKKSLTVEVRKGVIVTGIRSCSTRGFPHQLSDQKFIYFPSPISQFELSETTENSSLILHHKEEKI